MNKLILKRVACIILLGVFFTGILFTKDISVFIGKYLNPTVKGEKTEDISMVKVEVSNTETKIELITKWGEPVYTDKDSEEEKRRKIDEFFNKSHSIKEILIKDEYIENNKGERFYPVINSNDDNSGYNQMLDGTLRYWQTFNLTEYNATDTLKLVLNKQDKIIEINLRNK